MRASFARVLSGHFAWVIVIISSAQRTIIFLLTVIPALLLVATMMKFTLLSLALVLCAAQAEVLSLTSDNFDTATAGKNIFVKFFAPCTCFVTDGQDACLSRRFSLTLIALHIFFISLSILLGCGHCKVRQGRFFGANS